jgi:signal transduction histidine kinase
MNKSYNNELIQSKKDNKESNRQLVERTKELKDSEDLNVQLREFEYNLAQRTKQLEKSNNELTQFAYIASHDLKSPLRAVGNLATWIAEDIKEKKFEKIDEYVFMMKNQLKRMDNLINGLLEISRVSRTHVNIELLTMTEMIKELQQDFPEIEITHSNCGKCIKIQMNSTRFRQIFNNLINNAFKHNDKEKTIVNISCKNEGDYCEFVVEDNGPGIDSKYHKKIFQIFQTLGSKDNGTGIGLALVKKIVEEYDGEIRVESELGKGTKFIFTLKSQPICGNQDV